jgi:3-deoxy-D-manno-octulosonate 8-phosphate phosphatase (KDO 8-P phosphatase)
VKGLREVPVSFVLDVDGVLTNGNFLYTESGKFAKSFGADDHDALNLLRPFINIRFITGDRRGFEISARRVIEDMKFALDLVSTVKRMQWIRERYDPASVIYMGDGIFDHYVMQEVGYAIAPANADPNAKRCADFVTIRSGGDRAVAEACLHILERFYKPFDPNAPLPDGDHFSGSWLA